MTLDQQKLEDKVEKCIKRYEMENKIGKRKILYWKMEVMINYHSLNEQIQEGKITESKMVWKSIN